MNEIKPIEANLNSVLFEKAEKLKEEIEKTYELPNSFLESSSKAKTATEVVMMLEANNAKKG